MKVTSQSLHPIQEAGPSAEASPTKPSPARGRSSTTLNGLPARHPSVTHAAPAPHAGLPKASGYAEAPLTLGRDALAIPPGAHFDAEAGLGRHPGGERLQTVAFVKPGSGEPPATLVGIAHPDGHSFEVFDQNTRRDIGRLRLVSSSDGGKVAVDANAAGLKGGALNRGPETFSRSRTSATGYRLENGLACDRDGHATMAASRSSATGYRTLDGLACDRDGHARMATSRFSVTGFKTLDGLACDRDGYPALKPSGTSVTGYKTLDGLACDANGQAVMTKSRASVTGFKTHDGLACDADGRTVMATSTTSVTGFKTHDGLACDANGRTVMAASRASVTGFKTHDGLACDANGRAVMATSRFAVTGFKTPDGLACDGNGRAVMSTSQAAVTGFKTLDGLACDANGRAVMATSRFAVTGFKTLDGLACDTNGRAVVSSSHSSVSGFKTLDGVACDRDGRETISRSTSSFTGFRDAGDLPCDASGHAQIARASDSPSGFVRLRGGDPCNGNGHLIRGLSKDDLDPFLTKRLPAAPAPAGARYQKQSGMMAQYAGEDTSRQLWGTTVRYLSSSERAQLELTVDHKGLLRTPDGKRFDTRHGSPGGDEGHAIFAMDHNGRIFASLNPVVGKFHHSSFLGGQPVAGAGTLKVTNGHLDEVTRRSGHYRPTVGQHKQVVDNFERLGVDHFISSTSI